MKPIYLVAAPGTQGGPCDATARDRRVTEAGYAYVRAIVEGRSAMECNRLHSSLFATVTTPLCEHRDCARRRALAGAPCATCGKSIGFDEPYVIVDEALIVHEACDMEIAQAWSEAS